MKSFVNRLLFNRFKTEEIGQVALTDNLDLLVNAGDKVLNVLKAEGTVSADTEGSIRVGEYLVQFGRARSSSLNFDITYPTPLTNNPIYNSVQGSSNDGVFVNAEIDSLVLPSTTKMTVHAESANGTEYFYWMVIGRSVE